MNNATYSCQICHSTNLKSVAFFGFLPPVNAMKEVGITHSSHKVYPLQLVQCEDCRLVQIDHQLPREEIFPYSYPYLSGSTQILKDNFADLAATSLSKNIFKANDLVVDIGSNDGTLLKAFQVHQADVLGVEPTQAGEKAIEAGIPTLCQYFDEDAVDKILASKGEASLVTAANVFAHIQNPSSIVQSIDKLLKEEGVFISENHYLPSVVEGLQYDTVYHEHLRYYHLGALAALFSKHGFEIFDAELIPTHGGSIRVYAARTGKRDISNSVKKLLQKEEELGLNSSNWHEPFEQNVMQTKYDLQNLLFKIKRDGQSVYGIGAPSRASTLISYCGIDHTILDAVMEISTSGKLNKYMPGTLIPVLDEKLLFEEQPDYALLLSWHIAEQLIPILKNKGYKGKFIVPLPTAQIIE